MIDSSADFSPNLDFAYLIPAQAQKHVTMNEALRKIDALMHLSVENRDISSPPTSPANGVRYVVGPNATDMWAGHEDDVAVYEDGNWVFLSPGVGWLCWVADESLLLCYDGNAWLSAGYHIQNTALFGLGTSADITNPFCAKLNKALWTARTTHESGSGDLRYTLNKQATDNVLSILLQTDFSARAEIGLIGDDHLCFKVSDGTNFFDALRIDSQTGQVNLNGVLSMPSFTLSEIPLPDTVGAGAMIYISDADNGAIMAFSDGMNWRSLIDRSIIS